MKGSIFKHFESFVCENFGQETFEEILEGVDLITDGPFLGPDNYPDEDLLAIVGATIDKLQIPLPDALRAFGKDLFGKLAAEAPVFLENVDDLKTFLQMVDGVIHVEVKKLSPEAYLPKLECIDTGEGTMTMKYMSERQLCQLFLGLVEGAAERFSTELGWDHTACTHEGAPECTFEFNFSKAS